jgi:hypothetical protein
MASDSDLDLLRRFEPVVRFTRGEQFFPMDVGRYAQACSLWVQRPGEEPLCLVPQGQLSLEELARSRPDVVGAIHFLKLTDPLSAAELATHRLRRAFRDRDDDRPFRAGRGRLARVGYVSRFVDAAFSIALMARGRVPGDRAAAAAQVYGRMMAEDEQYRYCGRVLRQDGWIVLQYWFLYLYNNWRSEFFGANDHESDWEMICVYLYESKRGQITPEWVAYAAHDYSGDDLRRRWDDPELKRIGEHPVVYPGAGSHASYYTAGEYLTEAELPFLAPLVRITDAAQGFWKKTLRQYVGEGDRREQDEALNIFHVPFVDYARGDGLAIGQGQEKEWADPVLLNPEPPWVTQYRGLWGLYTRDPFAGEDAPAGPMYNRDGSIRHSWYDPIGWAGLDKETPSDEALQTVLDRQERIKAHRINLQAKAEEKSRELRGLHAEYVAMREQPHLKKTQDAHRQRLEELSQELQQLREESASDQNLLKLLERHSDRVEGGGKVPARAHIQRAHRPAPGKELRLGRLAEVWAAASVSVMLLVFVGLVLFAREHLALGLVAVFASFVFIESSFRGRLIRLITSVTIALAAVAALVVLSDYFWPIVVGFVLLTGIYILWENLRELWT